MGILIFSLFLKIFLKYFKNLALELAEYLKSRLYDIDIVIISLYHQFELKFVNSFQPFTKLIFRETLTGR